MTFYDVAHFASPRCWAYLSAKTRPEAIKLGMTLLRRHGGRVRITALGGAPLGSGYPLIWERGHRGRFGPLRGKASSE